MAGLWWRGGPSQVKVKSANRRESVSFRGGSSVEDNRSSNAARYGALAEQRARERYGLDADHASWHDARTSDGRPVETKSCMLTRRDGSEGRFRIFEQYHRKLEAADGLYVFAAYVPKGSGIQVRAMRSLEAGSLRLSFYGAGGHRNSRQVKIAPARVFG